MDNQILLSICIPTYNRAEYLFETITSIVTQHIFINSNFIEIVVSDNCSNDNTQQIVQSFIKEYGDKIRYSRNEINIKDSNFEKVLSLGSGEYLKLNNDTLSHIDGSLDYMLNIIVSNLEFKRLLFFGNGQINVSDSSIVCNDLNYFVKIVSYWMTWIGCFGIWKSDFIRIEKFDRYSELQLIQVDVWLRLMNNNREMIILNERLFESQNVVKKGGYNFLQVFVHNYFYILKEYISIGDLKKEVLFHEKFKIMKCFIIPWVVSISNDSSYNFSMKNGFWILIREYILHPGLLYFLIIFPPRFVYVKLFRKLKF